MKSKSIEKFIILSAAKYEIGRSPGIRQCSLFDLLYHKYGMGVVDRNGVRSEFGFAIWGMLKMDHEVIRIKENGRLSYVI